jgi:hypothetical protein
LGGEQEVRAVQINLAEQDVAQAVSAEDDVHRFMVEASSDAARWKVVADRSAATNASPHTYVEFDKPLATRYLKVTNVPDPRGRQVRGQRRPRFGVANPTRRPPSKSSPRRATRPIGGR